MLLRIFWACALVATTVIIHAISLGAVLRTVQSGVPKARRRWAISRLLIRVTWSLLLVHIVEIALWGLFYFWQNCLPDAESALYFSGASYTTIGFGDVVLPKPWRMFGPIEGLTGMLMGGLSAGVFVTLVNGIFAADSSRRHETADR